MNVVKQDKASLSDRFSEVSVPQTGNIKSSLLKHSFFSELSFYPLKIITGNKICLPEFSIKKLICKLQEAGKFVIYMLNTKEQAENIHFINSHYQAQGLIYYSQ